jgi:hypothetical protein
MKDFERKLQNQGIEDSFGDSRNPSSLAANRLGISVLESRELRRKAVLEDSDEQEEPSRGQASNGDLTIEMLGSNQPKETRTGQAML